MKINRNTINGYIDYWYSQILIQSDVLDPEYAITVSLQRLEIQRSRLREQLDKSESFQEKSVLNRLIFDIESKLLHTNDKLSNSRI